MRTYKEQCCNDTKIWWLNESFHLCSLFFLCMFYLMHIKVANKDRNMNSCISQAHMLKLVYDLMVTFCLYSINNFLYNTAKDYVRQILACTWITELSSLEDDSKFCPSFACIGKIMVNLITGSVHLVIKCIYAGELKVKIRQTMAERSQIAGVEKEQLWLLLYGSYIKEPSGAELFPVGLKSLIFFFPPYRKLWWLQILKH